MGREGARSGEWRLRKNFEVGVKIAEAKNKDFYRLLKQTLKIAGGLLK